MKLEHTENEELWLTYSSKGNLQLQITTLGRERSQNNNLTLFEPNFLPKDTGKRSN